MIKHQAVPWLRPIIQAMARFRGKGSTLAWLQRCDARVCLGAKRCTDCTVEGHRTVRPLSRGGESLAFVASFSGEVAVVVLGLSLTNDGCPYITGNY